MRQAIGEVGGSLDAGVTRTGMVHLYTLGDDGSLTWASTIVPQAGYDNGDFGFSMSLSGNVLLVGARRDHEGVYMCVFVCVCVFGNCGRWLAPDGLARNQNA